MVDCPVFGQNFNTISFSTSPPCLNPRWYDQMYMGSHIDVILRWFTCWLIVSDCISNTWNTVEWSFSMWLWEPNPNPILLLFYPLPHHPLLTVQWSNVSHRSQCDTLGYFMMILVMCRIDIDVFEVWWKKNGCLHPTKSDPILTPSWHH